MYLLLNCSSVNEEEWHPFTITSAPEEDFVSVNIKCPDELDWCSALRRKLVEIPAAAISDGNLESKNFKSSRVKVMYSPYTSEALFDPLDTGANAVKEDTLQSRPCRVEVYGKDDKDPTTYHKAMMNQKQADIEQIAALMEEGAATPKSAGKIKRSPSAFSVKDIVKPRIPKDVVQMRIDGAHGAPSELVWRHRVVVLVGAGIGVTPFASILKSITLRQPTQAEVKALTTARILPKSGSHGVEGDVVEWRPCEHVYFYWLCRSQEEFEWFSDLLSRAVSMGTGQNKIEVNLFKTGETELAHVKSMGNGFREFFGRPNWKRIFPKIAETFPNEHVGCFFCGTPALRGDLGTACRDVTATNKFGATFTLHAENF
jgi:hypothetical protein